MPATYRCRDGDMLDRICRDWYGQAPGGVPVGVVEKVMEANPGLADHGPDLPAGLLIILPDIEAPATEQPVRLWN